MTTSKILTVVLQALVLLCNSRRRIKTSTHWTYIIPENSVIVLCSQVFLGLFYTQMHPVLPRLLKVHQPLLLFTSSRLISISQCFARPFRHAIFPLRWPVRPYCAGTSLSSTWRFRDAMGIKSLRVEYSGVKCD